MDVKGAGDVEDRRSISDVADDSKDGSTDESPSPSRRQRLSEIKSRTKATTKKLFKIDGAEDDKQFNEKEDAPLDNIRRDPAFNPSQLRKKKHNHLGGTANKTLDAIQFAATSVIHPKNAIKSKATRYTASRISKTQRPYLSQKADLEFLQAHEDLERTESTSSSRQGTSDEDRDPLTKSHRDKIRELESHRESLRAAWTTGEHVRRVRVVPKRHINFPDEEFFVDRDRNGDIVRYDWLKWLGYNLIYYTQDFSAQYIDDFDELPFNVDSSRHYIERLVMASSPWQSWAMSVRAVYRWENPKTTWKWFVTYVVLWYTQHIIGFFYLYVIYIVLKNRFYPTHVESLRDSMKRARDSRDTSYRFGELVDKHGRHNWVEPLMDDLGPYIQLQLGDMANMLEVFSNFYHWKHPPKTIASLSFLASCLAVSVLADMEFCMKIVGFVSGGTFFLCWPIASLYPKYRYLVSPFKWALWDIPTHAEWSFQYLRRQAQETRERMIQRKIDDGYAHEVANPAIDKYSGRLIVVPKIRVEGDDSTNDWESDDEGWYSASSSTSVLEASEIRSFRAHCEGVIGRLIVFSQGVRFVRSVKKKEVWRCNFLELAEMRKVEGTKVSKILSSPDQLEIKCIDGRTFSIEGMKDRDEAFNTIIGFSSLQWQSLQIRHETNAQES